MTSFFLMLTLLAQTSALERVVQTERDFARTSELKGIRDSFLAFLDEEGILFRPGPVPGKKWMEEHPPAPGQLTWRPVYADISRAGDLGYTSGPYELKGSQGVRTGYYFTLWRQQKDGSFKFVLDYGISCPALSGSPAETFATPPPPAGRLLDQAGVRQARQEILNAEARLAAEAAAKGERVALDAQADDGIRLYRDGQIPAVTRASIRNLLLNTPGALSMKAENAGVSASGEFGYAYGSAVVKTSDSREAKTLHFVRVWKKPDKGEWRVVVDIRN